jgi:hypothetical protein
VSATRQELLSGDSELLRVHGLILPYVKDYSLVPWIIYPPLAILASFSPGQGTFPNDFPFDLYGSIIKGDAGAGAACAEGAVHRPCKWLASPLKLAA